MLLSGPKLKKEIEGILQSDTWKDKIKDIIYNEELSPTRHLFSMLNNKNELVRWRAVTSFGILAERHCENDFEKARELVRKAVWALTEESGGIAWGYPELIGEVLSRSRKLADSFHNMLFSYVYEDDKGMDNFLDHPPFRAGAIWGIMRLSEVFPEYINKFVYVIQQRQKEETLPEVIAYLLIIIKNSELPGNDAFIDKYKNDDTKVRIYLDEELQEFSLAEIAKSVKNRI